MIPRPPVSVLCATLFTALSAQAEGLKLSAVIASPTELGYSPQLQKIGVPAAWKLGATGKGVTVAVIDSGVNGKHSELRGAVLPGYNVSLVKLGTDSSDTFGHGTHVAGIIGAGANNFATVGVAPEAKILPIKVMDRYNTISYDAVDRGLRVAADYAPIANASLGGGRGAEAGTRYAVGKGLLLVVAAGNEGAANPSWPARYAKESWALGRIIAVGAVDQNNVMPAWSNRAGDTKQFYLVAPGVNVLSTYGSGWAYMSGTSMASPHVAGVAALIKSYWPKLKAEEVASILFRTATDLGAPGVDAVYGWGLVNAERALKPVGTPTVSSKQMTKTAVTTTTLTPPAASGSALKTKSLTAVAQDDFGRGFTYDLSAAIRTQPAPALAATLDEAGRRVSLVEQVLPNGSRYSMRIQRTESLPQGALAQHEMRATPASALDGFAWVGKAGGDREWAVGGNGFAQHFFGAMSALPTTREAGVPLAHPMFALVGGHSHFGFGWPVGEGWRVKAGALTTAAAPAFGKASDLGAQPPGARLVLGDLTHVSDRAALNLQVGQLAEDAAVLGSRSGDGLRIDGTPRTRFLRLEAVWGLGDRWAGFGHYTRAHTSAHSNAQSSLISGWDTVHAEASALGLMRADTWMRGDRLTLQLQSPLRIKSGELRFALPQGEDDAGALKFGDQAVSLAPRGREVQGQIAYHVPLSRHQSLSGFLLLRNHPGHDLEAPRDRALGLRWDRAF